MPHYRCSRCISLSRGSLSLYPSRLARRRGLDLFQSRTPRRPRLPVSFAHSVWACAGKLSWHCAGSDGGALPSGSLDWRAADSDLSGGLRIGLRAARAHALFGGPGHGRGVGAASSVAQCLFAGEQGCQRKRETALNHRQHPRALNVTDTFGRTPLLPASTCSRTSTSTPH